MHQLEARSQMHNTLSSQVKADKQLSIIFEDISDMELIHVMLGIQPAMNPQQGSREELATRN